MFLGALVLFVFAVGCSGGGSSIDGLVAPIDDNQINRVQNPGVGAAGNSVQNSFAEANGNTSLLGIWQVVIDKHTGAIDVIDLRSSDLVINVLGFLEPPALKGMTIDFSTLVLADPIVEVDVILTHPIPDPVFMGFDVRGVVFGPEVKNCDGLTVVLSPEFFSGAPFGYKDGLLGAPNSSAHYSGLAGYKYFCDGLAKDADLAAFMSDPAKLAKRGMFSQSPQKNTRHYILDWSNVTHGFLVFNYAIYANYNWPTGTPPIDINDFEITTSNSAEAFCAKVTEVANNLYYASGFGGGGTISLDVEVWDWLGDISNVTVESLKSGVIAKKVYDSTTPGTTPYSYKYSFVDVPGTPTEVGDLDILITVTDAKTFGAAWFMGLLPTNNPLYGDNIYSCWIHTASVVACPMPLVTSINPGNHDPDNVQFSAIVQGNNFISGSALAVTLKKEGQADIPAANLSYVDLTMITCDITIPWDTAAGFWDVEVGNGCGVTGTGVGLFEVTCPDPTVSLIDPNSHEDDDVSFSPTITGTNFVPGSSLAVALTRTGQTAIQAVNEVAQSPTEITCDITIPNGTLVGAWNVEVTNGCGTLAIGNNLFTVWSPIVWNPTVDIGSGEGQKVKDDSTITPAASSYDDSTLFNVNGGNASGGDGGTITYQWFASTSNLSQTGGDSWHAFTFNNGGNFTVSWTGYTAQSPSQMWLWVRAIGGSLSSDPVLCSTTMSLSETLWAYNSSFSSYFNSSSSQGSTWNLGNQTMYYGNVNSPAGAGWGLAWRTLSDSLTAGVNYTLEWSPTNDWIPRTDCYLKPQCGTSTSLGTDLASAIYNATAGQIFTHDFTPPSGSADYYFGYYGNDASPTNGNFRLYVDNTALYWNP